MGILKTVELADFAGRKCQNNTLSENGRDRIDRRKKCQKNTHSDNGIICRLCREKSQKNENFEQERERV